MKFKFLRNLMRYLIYEIACKTIGGDDLRNMSNQ